MQRTKSFRTRVLVPSALAVAILSGAAAPASAVDGEGAAAALDHVASAQQQVNERAAAAGPIDDLLAGVSRTLADLLKSLQSLLPGMTLPEIKLPTLPNLPTIPDVPPVDLPTGTGLPDLPDLPDVPDVPDVPIPDIPSRTSPSPTSRRPSSPSISPSISPSTFRSISRWPIRRSRRSVRRPAPPQFRISLTYRPFPTGRNGVHGYDY